VRAAKRLGFKHVKAPLVVATAGRPAADEKSYDVVLRFKRTFRARLAKARSLAFRIHAAFTDPLANDAAMIRVLKLTR
jgi:hypothetical protein